MPVILRKVPFWVYTATIQAAAIVTLVVKGITEGTSDYLLELYLLMVICIVSLGGGAAGAFRYVLGPFRGWGIMLSLIGWILVFESYFFAILGCLLLIAIVGLDEKTSRMVLDPSYWFALISLGVICGSANWVITFFEERKAA